MTTDHAIDLIRHALTLMLMLASPILLAALVIGLTVSVFQAVTQIQEQTLTFVPKILGMGMVAILLTPWLTTIVMEFARRMFGTME